MNPQHHLPKRLRESMPKILNAIKRELDEGFVGLSGLIPTSRTIKLKRRRRWWKRDERRHLRILRLCTGTIGGRSRARVWGWDPARARSDMTAAIGRMLDDLGKPHHYTQPMILMNRRDYDAAVAGIHPLFPPPRHGLSEIHGSNCVLMIADDLVPAGRPIGINPKTPLAFKFSTLSPAEQRAQTERIYGELDCVAFDPYAGTCSSQFALMEKRMDENLKRLHAQTIVPVSPLPSDIKRDERAWKPPGGYPKRGKHP